MSKHNTATRGARRARTASPVQSVPVLGARTYEGAQGYARDPRSELFLLGSTNFVSEDTFYVGKDERDARYLHLVWQLAMEKDTTWLTGLGRWLRTSANMRSSPLVLAAEAVKTRVDLGLAGGNRALIDAVLARPDEPGEFLSYWATRWGNDFPKPVRRGVGDAMVRMCTERNWLKYDSDRREWRFADVIAMCRPRPRDQWQSLLFRHILADRHDRVEDIPRQLDVLSRRQRLLNLPVEARRAELVYAENLDNAGFTFESLSGWLQGPMDRQAWTAIIPYMNVFALIRNLRNFDEAGVGDDVAQWVINKICDRDEVVRSRTLPMRWLQAYRYAPSDRWKHALALGMQHTLANIPQLRGQTLILVDMSLSMNDKFTKDTTLKRWDAAALFGLALAKRNEGQSTLVAFAGPHFSGEPDAAVTKVFRLRGGSNVLSELSRWQTEGYFLGGGTQTALALRKHYDGQDRVIVLTDEQAANRAHQLTVDHAIPAEVPMYTWNLAGYEYGHGPSGNKNRHTFGGLSDAAFATVASIESMVSGTWPWEGAPVSLQ